MLARTSSWRDSIGECTRMRSACARPSSNSWLCAVGGRLEFHLKEQHKRDVHVRDSYMIHVHRHPTPLTHRRINRKVNFCWRLDLDHSVALMQVENGWLYTHTHTHTHTTFGAAVVANSTAIHLTLSVIAIETRVCHATPSRRKFRQDSYGYQNSAADTIEWQCVTLTQTVDRHVLGV